MNLKFHAYRAAVRFLYVYLLNDKQQQSNSIRRFCKEYDIEIQDKPSSSINQLEETTNNDNSNLDEPDNDYLDLVVVSKHVRYLMSGFEYFLNGFASMIIPTKPMVVTDRSRRALSIALVIFLRRPSLHGEKTKLL
jgi:hypothetical protein